VTLGQFIVLCDHLYQAEFDKLKLRAAFFGVDLDKEVKKQVNKKIETDTFIFKAPEEYEQYSSEERRELTEKMMLKHRAWAVGRKEIGELKNEE